MEYCEAKTILSNKKDGKYWFGEDFNMNIYRGCSHGCIYCDSRSDCYGVSNFDVVKPKKDALLILEKELRSKRTKGVVGIGSMSDSYNPLENILFLTRGVIELLNKYGFGLSLSTKSALIERDIDVLKKLNETENVIVKFTITCSDDFLSKKIEPFSSLSSERFRALKKISDEGIFVGVLLMPILPFINDTEDNIRNIIKRSFESGAKFIYPFFGVTLRDNQRDYFYGQLDILYSNLKHKYIKTFGNSYKCDSNNASKLYNFFVEECKRYGLLYKMDDIINAYKNKKKDEQISLF